MDFLRKLLGRLGFGKPSQSGGTPWWFWLIVLAGVAYSAYARGKSEERAKVIQAELAVLRRADSAKADSIGKLIHVVAEQRAEVDSARGKVIIVDRYQTANIDSAMSALIPRLDSVSKVLVAKVVASYEARLVVREEHIASLEKLTKSQDQVISMQKALIKLNQDITKVTYDAWQNERKLSHPNLLKRVADAAVLTGLVLIVDKVR